MSAPDNPAKAGETAKPRRRILRAFAWVMLALLIALGGFSLWALNTQSGARFVLARVQSSLDQKLVVERSSGTLTGPLVLDGVRYVDATAGIDARIQHASVELGVLALLGGRVELSNVIADDVDVTLTTVAPKPNDGSKFSLNPPIDILVNNLALQRASITQDGASILAIDHLDLIGGWTHDGVLVKQLALSSPAGHIDLNGSLGTVGGYSGSGETTFVWRAGETDFAGVLKSQSDGKQARLDLTLSQPTPATAAITITQNASAAWNLVLDVPTFAVKKVLPDSTLGEVALHLQGSGDRAKGAITGSAEIEQHKVDVNPLRFALDEGIITLDAMHLTSAESSGALDLLGTVDTTVSPPRANLKATWQGVVLPEDLVGQPLATHGELAIDGSAAQFAAKGSLALGPPAALADIDVDINGTTEAITLNTVRLKQANGGLDASGSISLQPTLGWNIKATANHFDPGAFFADWPVAIDFVLDTAGTQTDKGPDATFVLGQVGGSLREKPLGGSADLHMKPGYIVEGNLELKSADSRISIEGSGGNQTDARIEFEVASLGDWLPNAGGKAHGKVHVSGQWPQLDVDGDIAGTDIAWSGIRVDSMELVAKITDLSKPAGALTLKATNVIRGGAQFETVVIEGDGNAASHQLSLVAKGMPASLELSMNGESKDGIWNGRLKSLLVDPAGRNLPDLELEQAARMSWDGNRFEVAQSCLIGKPPTPERAADGEAKPPVKAAEVAAESVKPSRPEIPARLCIGGSSGSDGSLAGKYQIEHLPLRLLVRLAAPDSPVRLRGEIHGSGEIKRKGNGPISGNAQLISEEGEMFYLGGGNTPLLTYSGFAVDAELDDASTTAKIRAALDHDGRIEGNITLTPAPGDTQSINGDIKLDLNSLAFLELLSTELTNTTGKLSANYAIAGTLAEPRLNGALNLDGFASEVPSAGLKLNGGKFSLRAANAQRFVLEGTIQSGKGSLAISGEGGLGNDDPMTLDIKGEDFLAADIPAAHVIVSPDLSVKRSPEGIMITGKLVIPSANVDLSRLPGGGASSKSPDVVIVDADQPEPGEPLPLTAKVTVLLGDKVKLAGFGFDGALSGDLVVLERPGRATTGNGTLNAEGTYKAYGQDLKIETGRILFANRPIDNPGLDIRATRTIRSNDVTAGVLIRGTAQIPVLTIFSNPSLEQSEALSYLVTGKPLSSLKSGEGDMLGTAARALGTAGGDLLAKSIGTKMGIDDIGVADNDVLGGAAFTVGKYLSPKLYLSYGVGVFDPGQVVTLRYLFSARWNFEAQNASTGSRAGFNYRFEK